MENTKPKWKSLDAKLQAKHNWKSGTPDWVQGVADEKDEKVDEHPVKGVAIYG